MAGVAQQDVETISNMSGDMFLPGDDSDVDITPADQPTVNLSF